MKSIAYCLLLMVAIAASPARAGLFDDEEARRRVDQMRTQLETLQRNFDQRFSRVENDVSDRRAVVDLASQIESTRAEMARLRGAMEVLQNQIEQQDKRGKDFYVDLDNRLRRMEQARVEDQKQREERMAQERTTHDRITQEKIVSDAASETKMYEAALNQFKLANYQAAIAQFRGFMDQFPNSQLLPSAQYWVGNGHYALRDYKAAISAQERVITSWPDNAKASDAMLNIASSQAELGDMNAARQTLRAVVDKYPKSPAADQARQRLRR
jgi:tol-pal system protein YbgF